jgi:uncharacterized RDD family membrane protein YckC
MATGVGRLGHLGSATSGLVIDRVLAGPLPEAVARAIVEHDVVRRVAGELGSRTDLDALVAEALDRPEAQRLANQVAERVVQSPEFRRLLEDVLSGPELRSALARQTTSFADEVAARAHGRTVELDERVARGASVGSVAYGGAATRGAAFAVDAAITHTAFVVGAALLELVASLFGGLQSTPLAATLAGVAWALLVGGYFTFFWSTVGQTPGLRLLRLRVEAEDGGLPSPGRSVVRFVGLVLAIVPLGAGLVPVLFDRRRRALQDFLAHTVVLRAESSEARDGGTPTET